MKTMLFTSAIFILILYGCKAQQYSIDDLPEKQLIFGNGGGMSGMVKTYTLLENGQLFHKNSLTEEATELESISKKEAKTCFADLEQLSLSEMNFDHPGNMYYFLETVEITSILLSLKHWIRRVNIWLSSLISICTIIDE